MYRADKYNIFTYIYKIGKPLLSGTYFTNTSGRDIFLFLRGFVRLKGDYIMKRFRL